jgi:DNA-directed RNA polymerase subunit RPC12/RpoP
MSKITYYKCVDCGSQISKAGVVEELMKAVYCWNCVNYDIDVVIAYE